MLCAQEDAAQPLKKVSQTYRWRPPMHRTAPAEMMGKPVPELSGTTLDGKLLALSSLRGKPVLLDSRSAIPTIMVVDRQGVIVDYQVKSGEETDKSIRAALRKLGLKIE